MIVTEPKTKKEFEKYYELRWRILRKPWGRPRGSEKDQLDESSFHIMVCENNKTPIAIGRLHFNSKDQCQIRYMAVEENHRGKGYGKIVLDGLEKRAKERDAKQIVLDARETAVAFYEKAGYKATEPGHTLFGSIKHIKMVRNI